MKPVLHLTRLWLALATLALLLGWLQPPGLQGLAEVKDWWTARRFEQAGLERNLPRLAMLAENLLEERREGSPAEFAGYLLAWAAPTPSMGYSAQEAAALTEEGRLYLEGLVERLPYPWSSLQILSNSLVLRALPGQDPGRTATGLTLHATWMASGGGLLPGGGAAAGTGRTSAAYREMLLLPPPERLPWLARRLQAEDRLPTTTADEVLDPVFGDGPR